MTEAAAAQIKAQCLRWLARREHSRHELAAKLAAKGFALADCQAAMAELAGRGLQSDARFAEGYALSRIRKGHGPLAIAHALSRHGIAGVDLDALAQAEAGGWWPVMERVFLKKYPKPPQGPAQWAKCRQFLGQRGFTAAMVREWCAQAQHLPPPY